MDLWLNLGKKNLLIDVDTGLVIQRKAIFVIILGIVFIGLTEISLVLAHYENIMKTGDQRKYADFIEFL